MGLLARRIIEGAGEVAEVGGGLGVKGGVGSLLKVPILLGE